MSNNKTMSNEISEILERFTDPERKRKRELDKSRKDRKKQLKALSIGKRLASDYFNDPIDETVYNEWLPYIHNVPTLAQLDVYAQVPVFTVTSQTNSISGILDFFANELTAREWLHKHLHDIGWTSNRTGYDPFSVSNCTAELLMAVPECYEMAVKQMRLVVAYIDAKKKNADDCAQDA